MSLDCFRTATRASALALLIAGCSDSTPPVPQKLVDVLLDFCSNDTPVWLAHLNEGAQWTPVAANSEGTFSFTANNHVVLAFVRQSGSDYHTEIIYTTSTDLEKVTGQACLEEGGSKTYNGTVAGVSGSQQAVVTMNFSSVYLTPQQTSFALTQLADRPLDLVASRVVVAGNAQASDRVIIRRSQNLVNNSTMPVLDFAGAEAITPTSVTATVSGLSIGETTLLQNNFFSQLETSQTLFALSGAANGASSVTTLPVSVLAAGDYHDLFAFGIASTGSVRGVERFYRAGNQTLPLGAALATPTISTLGTTPYVRLRAQLARQTEYGGAVNVEYSQQHPNQTLTTVSITMTSGYDPTGSWTMDIPSLSSIAGWQNSWGLLSGGGTIEWTVSAYSGRPELLLGAKPNDNETVSFASRSSSTSALQAMRVGAPAVSRPRPLSRRR